MVLIFILIFLDDVTLKTRMVVIVIVIIMNTTLDVFFSKYGARAWFRGL